MSQFWLAFVPPDAASGRLKEVYERVKSPKGQVDRVYQAQSLRPETILGHDRPGIVGTVARVLFEQNCNIENVSQTILQTEFSGSFIVTLPSELLPDQLQKILVEELASMDMHVHIATLAAAGDAFQSKGSEPFVITTKGPDRKGLVAGISAVIC